MARDRGGGSQSCAGGRSKLARRCGAVDVEWAGAGRRACFSSRGLQLLQAARWQIGSGDGAVRTWRCSNWIGDASWVRADRLDCRCRWCRAVQLWQVFTCTRARVQDTGNGKRAGCLRLAGWVRSAESLLLLALHELWRRALSGPRSSDGEWDGGGREWRRGGAAGRV
jgi:hypothetical protein